MLVQYVPENEKGMSKALRDFDPNGYYHVSWVGIVALVYNTSKVNAADAPKDWPDLTDPKWKNQITFGSPNYSGLVGVWTVAMADKYGWDYFEKLNKLNPLIGRSVDDAITVLNSGERSSLPATQRPLSAARPGQSTGGQLPNVRHARVALALRYHQGVAQPERGEAVHGIPGGPEYSKILAKNFEQPLRDDVPPPPGAKSLSDMKVLSPKLAEIEKELPANKEKWRDTFG